MEEKLQMDTIEYYAPVFRTVLTGSETAEGVLSDSMPDIARILDASATAYLGSRQVCDGGVTLEGTIQATVLYVGEEEPRIQKWELSVPFTLTGETPELRPSDSLTAWVCVESAEATAVSSRRISLKAEIGAMIAAYRAENLDLSTQGTDMPGLQTLEKECTISYIASLAEKTFTVSEELSLPTARPPLSRLLQYTAQTVVDETKQVAGKMILQGTVQLQLLYLTAEDDTPLQESFSVPFSQIMDAPEGSADTSTVVLCPVSGFLEPMPGINGSRSLSLELQLLAQTICRVEKKMRYIADAYCLRCPCRMEMETAQVSGAYRSVLMGDTIRQNLEIPDAAGEILYACAVPGVPMPGEGKIRLSVSCHVLYRSERGQLSSAVKKLRADLPAETPA